MARIRTIKPELWTDPDFVERSTNARLLFIAGLNFASDFGVLPDKPLQLKMQCFPGDVLDVAPLIDELVGCGLWLRATAPDGARVLLIRTFSNHQKVDRPNYGRWGDPRKWADTPIARREFDDDSTNDRRTITPGREGKGREVTTPLPPPSQEGDQRTCPRCQADPGEPCQTSTGTLRTEHHSARLKDPLDRIVCEDSHPIDNRPTPGQHNPRHPPDRCPCQGVGVIETPDGCIPCTGTEAA